MTRSNSGVVWRMMRIRFFTLWELDPTFNMMRIRIQLFVLICLLIKVLQICDTDLQTLHGYSLHAQLCSSTAPWWASMAQLLAPMAPLWAIMAPLWASTAPSFHILLRIRTRIRRFTFVQIRIPPPKLIQIRIRIRNTRSGLSKTDNSVKKVSFTSTLRVF